MAIILESETRFASGERHAREQLAALYRVFVHFGWTDLTDTHISARVPGMQDQYLINPYGYLFEEITASSLLKVDFEGNVLSGDHPYNSAGHLIHTAVLKARPEIDFVLHSHTRAGIAVSAMKDGLLPISQHANAVLGTLNYHDYHDVTAENAACEMMARDLGDAYCLVLRNHGLLTCGRSAHEAFAYHYFLEMACKVQVDVMRSGAEIVTPGPGAIEDVREWGRPGEAPGWGGVHWSALLRRLERTDPDYKT